MKKLIFVAIVTILIAGCSSTHSQKTSSLIKSKNIGIQLWSVKDEMGKDIKGTVAALGAMGYKSIEAAGYNDGKFYNLSPAEFKSLIEANGMKALSSHARKALDNDISSTNWDDVWKWWDQAIEAHKAAGMKYIVMPSMPTPKTLADLQVYCDYYNKIGEKCNAAGLKFGYHNHDFEFKPIEGKLMYDYLLENTDRSKVFFEMDTYWTVKGGYKPADYFNKYPGRFDLLHIKDEKELVTGGMMDFDPIFQNLDKAGTKHLIVEVEHYNYAPLESVKRSLEYLLNNDKVKADYSK